MRRATSSSKAATAVTDSCAARNASTAAVPAVLGLGTTKGVIAGSPSTSAVSRTKRMRTSVSGESLSGSAMARSVWPRSAR
ncbi:hypothetical protein AQJ27_28470 [Streptomyces olivochromogenes]|nr:hypothetical protein AQJ27_28470 [Streptomyces olivochromogenes]